MAHARVVLLVLAFALSTLRGDEAPADPAPDRAQTRAQLDAIVAAAGRRATLGAIRAAIDNAIAFGAPAYNAGDRAACADAYAETVQRLDRAFAAEDAATAPAREALAALHDAGERARSAGDDVDARAWSLRCGFDQVVAAYESMGDHGARLVGIAVDALRRGHRRDALAAADAALVLLDELVATRPEALAVPVRLAPLVQAQALLADGRHVAAAAALKRCVAWTPELAKAGLDLRQWWPEDGFAAMLAALQKAVDGAPDDARLRFALGCEQRLGGDAAAGQATLRRALSLDPALIEAKRLLDPDADASAPLP